MNSENGTGMHPCSGFVRIITQVHLEIQEKHPRWEAIQGKGLQGAGMILLEWRPLGWVILMGFSEATPAPVEPA